MEFTSQPYCSRNTNVGPYPEPVQFSTHFEVPDLRYILMVSSFISLHKSQTSSSHGIYRWCVRVCVICVSVTIISTFILFITIITIYVMELGHLLARSGLTYPEVSPQVYHDSFCQLGSSILIAWVIYFEAFYLHVVSNFSCIPVIFPKLVLFLTPLQSVHLFCDLS